MDEESVPKQEVKSMILDVTLRQRKSIAKTTRAL